MTENNLWERLLPQARELILQYEGRYPATTKAVIDALHDTEYHTWTVLPYYIVKFIHEWVFNAGALDLIEEDEIRTLFKNYYE